MLQVIKCPSCAAPLECDGDPFEKCDFCGSQIAVNRNNVFSENSFGFNGLLDQAHKLKDILRLARGGNQIEAIKLYRETFNCSLADAKDAVERLARGQIVQFQNVQLHAPNTVSPEVAKTALKAVGIFSGSMLLISLLIGVVIVLVVGGVLWLVLNKVDTAARQMNPPGVTPVKVGENPVNSAAHEVLRFGGEGTGAGKFTDNRVIAVDGDGKIYSADYSGGRVQVFDPTGRFLTQWFVEKKEQAISALAASRKGTVYISQVGKILAFEGATGKPLGEAKADFLADLAVTPDGKVVAAARSALLVFDESLKNLSIYKDAAKAAGVSSSFGSVAVNGLGEIFAISRTGRDLCKFSADGKFVDRFKVNPTSVHDLAVDSKGRIFIAETSKVWIYQADGNLVDSFAANQCFGLIFNDQGELLTASRPFIVKYGVDK